LENDVWKSELFGTAPNSIVLTRKVAQNSSANPVGQSLRVDNGNHFTITGVMEDVPSQFSIQHNGLISMATAKKSAFGNFSGGGM
jgi:hypothetical protein